jgi:hypothetical protein
MPPPPGQSGELPPGFLTGEAKARRQRSDRRKRVLTIAAGVLALLVAVLATVVLTAKGNEDTSIADLDEGECFNGADPNDVSVLDCEQVHASQLVAVVPAPDPTAAFPADTIQSTGETACTTEFEAYYGAPVATAVTNGLDLSAVTPTADQWAEGETDTFCVVIGAGGADLQGSMEGKGAGG